LARALALALALVSPALCPRGAQAEAPPEIGVLTMGPGRSLFDGFGHTALLLRDPNNGTATVYTYGALRWTGPLLGWRFLRGEVKFEGRQRSLGAVLRSYAKQDRPVSLQPLLLEPEEARTLAARLAWSMQPENVRYLYHHFNDNCSTRPRDFIDEASGGALRRALSRPGDGSNAREQVLRGLSLNPALLLLMNVVLGRPTEPALDQWRLSFVPAEFAAALAGATRTVNGVERPFVGPARPLVARRSPLERWDTAWGAHLAWLLALGVLGLVALGAGALRRDRQRGSDAVLARRLLGGGLLAWALVGGGLGLVLDTVATSEFVPEFRHNENLLLYTALDLWLLWPAWNALRGRGGALRGASHYLLLRGGLALLVGLAQGLGLLVQTPLALAGLAASATLGLGLLARYASSTPAATRHEARNAGRSRQRNQSVAGPKTSPSR